MENTENIIELKLGKESVIVPEIVDKKTSKGYVNWGEDNKLPDYLWDSYLKCSNLQSIVNTVSDYIVGSGIDSTYTFLSDEDETIEEVVKKITLDYILFGGFALECIRNAKGDVVRVNYQNVMNVRVDEELTTAYLSNKWGSWSGKNIITLPLFDKREKQPHFLFYFRGNITRNINPIPLWISALKSVEVLNQTRTFNLNNITNNFSGGAVIAFNGTQIKSKEMKEIKEKLEAGYTGSDNAGKMLVVNNPNGEGKVEVTRLQPDNMGDLYRNLQDSSKDDLFVAFRCNPILLGKNDTNGGFNKQEFAEAYKLYNATVILPLQNNIVKCLKKIGLDIKFKPFKIDWED